MVVCCAPPQPPSPSSSSTTASTSTSTSNSTSNSCSSSRFDSALSVWELLRITASSGHLVLGAPSSEFRRRGYLEELQRTSEGSNTSPFRGSLLSIQHVQLAATETETQLQRQRQEQHQSVAGSTGNATGDDAGENDNEYTIALYRKL